MLFAQFFTYVNLVGIIVNMFFAISLNNIAGALGWLVALIYIISFGMEKGYFKNV